MGENDRVCAMRRLGREELEELTPKQALDRVIGYALLDGGRRHRRLGPGEMVSGAGDATRQALAELTPADVCDVREETIRDLVQPDEIEQLRRRIIRRW